MNADKISTESAFDAGAELWILPSIQNNWWQQIDFHSGFLLSECLLHQKKEASSNLLAILKETQISEANYLTQKKSLLGRAHRVRIICRAHSARDCGRRGQRPRVAESQHQLVGTRADSRDRHWHRAAQGPLSHRARRGGRAGHRRSHLRARQVAGRRLCQCARGRPHRLRSDCRVGIVSATLRP